MKIPFLIKESHIIYVGVAGGMILLIASFFTGFILFLPTTSKPYPANDPIPSLKRSNNLAGAFLNPEVDNLNKNINITDSITETPFFSRKDFQLNSPIFMYHYIRPLENISPIDIVGRGLSVSPTNFERQLQEIKERGYNSITFQDLENYIEKSSSLPSKPIMLTFDDGYDNAYTTAMPLLQKYNLKASFAIITGFVGRPGYMSWEQIKDLKKNGFQIVSHSVNHPNLATISLQKLTYELHQSKSTLDSVLNQDTKVIVYPSGKYNDQVIDLARKEGYILGRTTRYSTSITPTDLLDLGAVRMGDESKI